VKKAQLESALRRVSLLVEQKSRRIYLNVSENLISLSSEESEIGKAMEEVECRYEGPEMNIALNYLYLLDPLKVISEEEIVIRFTEPNRAITLLSKPEREFFHIVMPMQLD
jgi:DNA polymerase-3 subunit beta